LARKIALSPVSLVEMAVILVGGRASTTSNGEGVNSGVVAEAQRGDPNDAYESTGSADIYD
jgi:hypothetical protein